MSLQQIKLLNQYEQQNIPPPENMFSENVRNRERMGHECKTST